MKSVIAYWRELAARIQNRQARARQRPDGPDRSRGCRGGLVPLSSLPAGASARLVHIDGRDGLDRRLFALGLTPGTPVQVVAAFDGPVVVRVRGVRLALDARAAARTWVRLAGTSGLPPDGPCGNGRHAGAKGEWGR